MITSKKLTAERIAEIEKIPVTYDEDSPKFTKEELQELAEVCREKDILIVSDEIYEKLCYTPSIMGRRGP